MKLLQLSKDGGPQSTVAGFFITEVKRLFSVAVLRFANGSREAFHSHAFHSVSWVLRGKLTEHMIDGTVNVYKPSIIPVITKRSTFHKVVSEGTTWVLTFRGPWVSRWREYLPDKNKFLTLTHGRKIVA